MPPDSCGNSPQGSTSSSPPARPDGVCSQFSHSCNHGGQMLLFMGTILSYNSIAFEQCMVHRDIYSYSQPHKSIKTTYIWRTPPRQHTMYTTGILTVTILYSHTHTPSTHAYPTHMPFAYTLSTFTHPRHSHHMC